MAHSGLGARSSLKHQREERHEREEPSQTRGRRAGRVCSRSTVLLDTGKQRRVVLPTSILKKQTKSPLPTLYHFIPRDIPSTTGLVFLRDCPAPGTPPGVRGAAGRGSQAPGPALP